MPTVRRCCIVGCMSNSRQAPSLQFFQFPRPDNPFYKLWTQACQASLSRILPFKKPVVCALHFHPQCIGGRRLTGSAVPTLKLEVPSNLKAVEQQAMVEEIERSRRCAYINAVVYEWLVRANLNPQLRGSITHGMIKEKAETAKQIIGCDSFTADNRWLNRFRETHLTGFAQKLASNQLKPIGPSLWIPDIVQDLAHLFPPTSAERIENFENVPEQYISYMKQYGEYEEEDDPSEQEPTQTYQQEQNNGYGQDTKLAAQSYYQQQQVAQSYYHQQQQQHHQQQQNGYHHYNNHPHAGMHPGAPYSSYHDYYNERPQHPQQHYHHQQHPQQHNGAYAAHPVQPQLHLEQTQVPMPAAQHQQQPQTPSRPPSHSPPQQNGLAMADRASPYGASPSAIKRPRSIEPDTEIPPPTKSSRTSPVNVSAASSPPRPTSKSPPTVIENGVGETKSINNNNIDNSFKIKLPLANGSGGGGSSGANSQRSSTPNSQGNILNSRSNSPKSLNGQTTNGNTSPTPSQSTNATKDLETYAQALEYLKPLEDFALFKENFRAIGLISQLEIILKKANKPSVTKSIAAE
ncbi:integrator complex subunit 3 homolog [Calliphora vicina]|uniref:integrator complex subunit 3 homolog n=1 Tax=Calliphora vicina TaxID=7373 RepID=UPI00325C0F1E